MDNPHPPLTHALHHLTRTLNIPSVQHSIANPRPRQHSSMCGTLELQQSVHTLSSQSPHQVPLTCVNIVTCSGMTKQNHPQVTIPHAQHQLLVPELLSPSLDIWSTPSFPRIILLSGEMRIN